MSEMAEPAIGERIRELRHPRYTQVDLAVAADISVDVIRKLEQGRRHTASIATLTRIARVLGVDLADLLGPSWPVSAASGDQDRVVAIRDALTNVDDLLGELDDADAPDLTEFSRAVTYAFGLYWAGWYGPLTRCCPAC
jgi:transcriptional regulator with XRE-family HTH domain